MPLAARGEGARKLTTTGSQKARWHRAAACHSSNSQGHDHFSDRLAIKEVSLLGGVAAA
jgi:hypothetical protein